MKNNKDNIFKSINELVRWITITRGGYHIILNRNDITGKFIGILMNMKIDKVEFRKEAMTPIPGTLQGGFVVKEYEYDII